MSQCRTRKRRSSLILFSVVSFILTSCTFTALEKFATENENADAIKSLRASNSGGASVNPAFQSSILKTEFIIKGGQQVYDGAAGKFRRILVGPGDDVRFVKPVAVGGAGDYLYIVDAGARIVFKYNLLTRTVLPIGNVGSQFMGEPGNIYVSSDLSFYVVDSVGKQVHKFSETGVLLATFKDSLNLSRPMDVHVDDISGDVYVADGSYSHIVVFNQFGKAIKAIGRRGTGPGRFRAITFMVRGLDGLYVLDRLELPIQVFSMEGQFKYTYGAANHIYPTAIAIDENDITFVSDKSDNTIRIYQNGKYLSTTGGGGSAPGRFRLITGLWVKDDYLFVADSLNKRIQAMKITPPPTSSPPAKS